MGTFLGYGEDALTLWALSSKLSSLLSAFGDQTPISETIVFYRPSFGRGQQQRGVRTAKAEFGEFDAIVGTRERVYPIEAKWECSRGIAPGGIITLRPEQARRH